MKRFNGEKFALPMCLNNRCLILFKKNKHRFLKFINVRAKIVTLFDKKLQFKQKNLDKKIQHCLNETSSVAVLMERGAVRGRCFRHPLVPTKNESYIG